MPKIWLTVVAAIFVIAATCRADADPLGSPPAPRVGVDHFGIARLLRAAESGNARAQTRLGFMHETGQGVPQDYVMAALWYRRAAERGEPVAQHLLGLLYDKGFGVPRDLVEAHKWLNLAAGRAPNSNREYYARLRNALASKMNGAEVAQAMRRARHWAPKVVW